MLRWLFIRVLLRLGQQVTSFSPSAEYRDFPLSLLAFFVAWSIPLVNFYQLERPFGKSGTCYMLYNKWFPDTWHARACPHENTYIWGIHELVFIIAIIPALLAAAVDAPKAFSTVATAARTAGDIILASTILGSILICRVWKTCPHPRFLISFDGEVCLLNFYCLTFK